MCIFQPSGRGGSEVQIGSRGYIFCPFPKTMFLYNLKQENNDIFLYEEGGNLNFCKNIYPWSALVLQSPIHVNQQLLLHLVIQKKINRISFPLHYSSLFRLTIKTKRLNTINFIFSLFVVFKILVTFKIYNSGVYLFHLKFFWGEKIWWKGKEKEGKKGKKVRKGGKKWNQINKEKNFYKICYLRGKKDIFFS